MRPWQCPVLGQYWDKPSDRDLVKVVLLQYAAKTIYWPIFVIWIWINSTWFNLVMVPFHVVWSYVKKYWKIKGLKDKGLQFCLNDILWKCNVSFCDSSGTFSQNPKSIVQKCNYWENLENETENAWKSNIIAILFVT